MLIIIEGPDCAGKSYLVERLRSRLWTGTTRVLHAGPPRTHPLDEYELPLLSYRPGRDEHVICDRWHLGELVYPALLGRPSHLDRAVLRHIELLLASRGALLVVLTPDEATLRDCLDRRGDAFFDPLLAGRARASFIEATNRTTLPLVWLKDEDEVDVDVENVILAEAEVRELSSTRFNRFVTYVGVPEPDLLLLGDVRKTGTAPDDLRPAFMPYPATSGHYLLETVDDATYRRVGVVNACDVDDPRALWETLDRPRTVTLGRAAQRVAPWADAHAPHPQWHRRFHYHDRDAYRALLNPEVLSGTAPA